jgi:REP element-mobilizing transposase RayT
VVRTFKAVSTRQVRQTAEPSFAWQRNYYEHIIRDDAALERIRDYIVANPRKWELDHFIPTTV